MSNTKVTAAAITVLIIVSGLLSVIFSVTQKASREKMKLEAKIAFFKEDIDLLLANELWAIKSEQTRIDPKFKLNTLQADSVKIMDIVNKGKLIFYFSEYDCQLCYQDIIDKLNHYVEMYGATNVAIIVHFSNLRNFHFFRKNTKIEAPVYYTIKSIDMPATNANQPFFFVLDQSFKAKFVFIPDKKYIENIDPYFLCVNDFFNNSRPCCP